MNDQLRRFYAGLSGILQIILVVGASSTICGGILFAATTGDIGLGLLLVGSALLVIVALSSLGNAQGGMRRESS